LKSPPATELGLVPALKALDEPKLAVHPVGSKGTFARERVVIVWNRTKPSTSREK